MVLGKLPVPGRPTIWITVEQGPTALAIGAGGGCLDIFTLVYPFFPLSPSLWETARYRLKYCLKGPLNPKPTNQPKIPCVCVLLIYVCSQHICCLTPLKMTGSRTVCHILLFDDEQVQYPSDRYKSGHAVNAILLFLL